MVRTSLLSPSGWILRAVVVAFLPSFVPAPGHAQDRPPFSKGMLSAQVAATVLVEAWDKNLSSERLVGETIGVGYGVREGWLIAAEAAMLHVSQSVASGAVVGGVTAIVRRRTYSRRSLVTFVEGGLGVSYADKAVPPRGTRFNYLLQVGGGLTYFLARDTYLETGARWFHLSNSRPRPHSNPDIQAFGGYAGLLVRLH